MERLKVLEQKADIDKAQSLFVKKLKQAADKTEKIWVGYQGGNEFLEASWSKALGIWWVHSTADENRYWNAFGIGEPKWGTTFSHSIICEINPPFEGINRYMAGAFAMDSKGQLYLLHRGKIGGGKPGNSKTKFVTEYNDEWISAADGGTVNEFAMVAPFESSQFADRVAKFVYQIERMKNH